MPRLAVIILFPRIGTRISGEWVKRLAGEEMKQCGYPMEYEAQGWRKKPIDQKTAQ